MSEKELAQIFPLENIYTNTGNKSASYKELYRTPINLTFRRYGLNKPNRMAHFFGQVAQESYYFMLVREAATSISTAIQNNHISIQSETNGYLQITPENRLHLKYFSEPGQTGYYEGKLNLGNTSPGDGIKFRGRGMKQLTGRYNYSEYWVFRGWLQSGSFDKNWFKSGNQGPIINNPQIVAEVPYNSVDTAGFFCAKNKINKVADGGVSQQISERVSILVNPYERPIAPRRLTETTNSYKVLGDEI